MDIIKKLELQEFRKTRDIRLLDVDKWQGVISYNTLTQEQKDELANYRLALLDAPQTGIIPDKPLWV